MKIPNPIKPGSIINLVSPAGKITEEHINPAITWFEKNGYFVKTGKHILAQHFQFAGTDEQRLEDLQTALDDPDIDVIMCSRGGYGTVRIINHLDFSQFQKNPKWIVGFSDITILHAAINKLGFATIHGAMPRHFFDSDEKPNENLKSLITVLSGEKISYKTAGNPFNRAGFAKAEIIGGNLSILSSLHGTTLEPDTKGKILFLEDVDEFLYHTDRMIHQLKLAGKFENLAGLIVGDFTDMKDNESPFGNTVHEIISEAVKDYDLPVCFGFPGGHDKKNLALPFGKVAELEVTPNYSTLKF